MLTGAWKAKWIVDGRPQGADEGYTSDDDADTIVDSVSASASDSSIDPANICGTCFTYDADGMDECGACDASICFSASCAKPCVACEATVCAACLKSTELCASCNWAFETRSAGMPIISQNGLASVHTPAQYQSYLDRITESMGLDPEYELRGEDGLEVWPPLAPLPKTAEAGQRTIDAYVCAPPDEYEYEYASDHSSSYDGGGDSETIEDDD